MTLLFLSLLGICYSTVNYIVNPTVVSFDTDELNPTTLSAAIFVPAGASSANPLPAIVFAHGDAGLRYFLANGSSPLKDNYIKWANIAVCANAIAIFPDSFTSRGTFTVDPVTVRPYDIYAAYSFLTTDLTYSPLVDSTRIYTVGWGSSGGQAVVAAISSTDSHYVNKAQAFASAAAFYPSCALDSSFGGLSNSTYCPYCPLSGQMATLASSGLLSCSLRKAANITCAGLNTWVQKLYWTNQTGAVAGFDDSTTTSLPWTAQDVQASQAADPDVLSFFGLTCGNPSLWLTPDASGTNPPTLSPSPNQPNNDPTPTGGAPCVNDNDCGGVDQGVCIEGVCVCNYMYANVSCNYARKNRQFAGGMQIGMSFLGVGGVGMFILGNNGIAIGQLILMASGYLMCITCCLCCPLYFLGKAGKAAYTAIMTILSLVVGLAVLAGWIWTIVVGALILDNQILDSNGYATYWPQ